MGRNTDEPETKETIQHNKMRSTTLGFTSMHTRQVLRTDIVMFAQKAPKAAAIFFAVSIFVSNV